ARRPGCRIRVEGSPPSGVVRGAPNPLSESRMPLRPRGAALWLAAISVGALLAACAEGPTANRQAPNDASQLTSAKPSFGFGLPVGCTDQTSCTGLTGDGVAQ